MGHIGGPNTTNINADSTGSFINVALFNNKDIYIFWAAAADDLGNGEGRWPGDTCSQHYTAAVGHRLWFLLRTEQKAVS
jgi:hypothetical protein